MIGKSIGSSISMLVLGIFIVISPGFVTDVRGLETVQICSLTVPGFSGTAIPCAPPEDFKHCLVSSSDPINVTALSFPILGAGGGKAGCQEGTTAVIANCGIVALPCFGQCATGPSPDCLVSPGATFPFKGDMASCAATSVTPLPVTAICRIVWIK